MDKIKSLDELRALKYKLKSDNALNNIVISVGTATCGIAAGAKPVIDALLEEIHAKKLKNVSVKSTGCIGFCYAEPLVEINEPGKDPIRYGNVTAEMAKEIIDKHILQGIFLDNAIVGKEIPKNE
ncbi:MAG: (2Fe-2S) ferredoxin domain-containing protein [Oscillospiraceae bacterium]|nr:(2Fe-2S) ferredoxin domain-containing protein [Oscillospiraceae bacterium]